MVSEDLDKFTGSTTEAIDYGWIDGGAPSCGYIAPKIIEIIKNSEARRIVDVGCGNGALVGQLTELGYIAVGIENDPIGRSLADKAYTGCHFYDFSVHSDPAELLATEPLFDTVISTEVIEHLFSPHQLIQYAHAILVPDGELILSTPYHGYVKNLAIAVTGKWDHHHTALWHGGHIKFWSRKTLETLVEQNGFRVTGFHGVGRVPFLWKSMIITARKIQ